MSSTEALDAEGSAWLSDTALSALELREQPFAPASADGETFTDDITAEQLADIRQALITGDDLLLILGGRGAGKSTLLAQLAANSGLRVQCFSVSGSPRFSTRNLFMGMLEAFKVEPPEDLKATLDELIPCLQAMIAGNKLCVIVLDDAEALAEHELTTLLSGMLYINSRDESLLRIALSAGPAFEERIPDLLPEGADLPYSSLSLEPFDTDRAAAYLGFRLARAGRLDGLPFDEDEVAALNERAGGRPGPLHVVAAAALEEAYGDPDTVPVAAAGAVSADAIAPEDDLPPELRSERRPAAAGGSGFAGRATKLALGALAGAMIVGGLLLFRPAPEPGAAEERYRVVEQRKVETERLRLLEEEDGTSVAAAAPATGPDAADGEVEADDDVSELALAPAEGDAAGEEPMPPSDPASTTEPSTAPPNDADADAGTGDTEDTSAGVEPPASEPATEPASPAGDSDADAAADGTDTVEADPVADPVADATPERDDEPAPDAENEPGAAETADTTDTAPPEAPAAAPAPTTAAGSDADAEPIEDEADAEGGTDDEATDVALADPEDTAPSPVAPPPEEPPLGALESPNWVLVQNPAQYTVQMSASTDRASVEQFLERAQLPAPNSIFSFDRNGRTWYALVHGLYPSVSAARSAIERMPSEALTNQPWIRAVGRIQETLRERN